MFQQGHIGHTGIFGDSDIVCQGAQCGWRHTAPAQTGNCQHARIVPAVDEFLVHKLDQFTLAHHAVRQIEPREFVLMRTRFRNFERVENPIIEGPVRFELEGANRVRDPFDVITERVRPVVHRVDAPIVPGTMMRRVPNPVEHWVTQPNVRRVHIDLCSQCVRAIRKLPRFHSRKQIEIFIDRTFAKAAGPSETAICVRFLGSHVVNVRLPFADKIQCILVKPIEIIRCIEGRAAELFLCPAVD